MSVSLGHPLTIITFVPLDLLVSFFLSLMSTTNLSLDLDFVVSLVMAKLKKGIGVMILSLIFFVGNVVFWEHQLFVELSHFCSSLTTSSVLNRLMTSYPNLSLGPLLLLCLKILHKTVHLATQPG